MPDDKKEAPSIGEIRGVSGENKIKTFFKKRFSVIILIIGCLVMVLKDALQWQIQNSDLKMLLMSIAMTYFFTMYVYVIMGKIGLDMAKDTDIFKNTMNYYGKIKKESEPNRPKLAAYCRYKNEEEKKIIQKAILDEANLELDKLETYDVNKLDKFQKKAVLMARKVKIPRLQEKDLLSERGKHKKSVYGTYLGITEKEFETKNNAKGALMKLLVPIVLSYVGFEGIILSNLLGGLVKVTIIVFGGLSNLITNREFGVNDLRNRFINKADALVEFNELCEQGMFTEETNPAQELQAEIIKLEGEK